MDVQTDGKDCYWFEENEIKTIHIAIGYGFIEAAHLVFPPAKIYDILHPLMP